MLKRVISLFICYFSLLHTSYAAPSDGFGINKADPIKNKLETDSLEIALQNYVNYLMTFLYLIAVLYAIWGGFLILTAGGDEEKVKKWKTVLIHAGIGLFVIWIAATMVKFVLGILAN